VGFEVDGRASERSRSPVARLLSPSPAILPPTCLKLLPSFPTPNSLKLPFTVPSKLLDTTAGSDSHVKKANQAARVEHHPPFCSRRREWRRAGRVAGHSRVDDRMAFFSPTYFVVCTSVEVKDRIKRLTLNTSVLHSGRKARQLLSLLLLPHFHAKLKKVG
jgi:hypothetical protein